MLMLLETKKKQISLACTFEHVSTIIMESYRVISGQFISEWYRKSTFDFTEIVNNVKNKRRGGVGV